MEFVRGSAVPSGDPVEIRPLSPLQREENMRSPEPLSSSSTTMFTAMSGSGRSLASSSTSLYPLYPFSEATCGAALSQGSGSIGDFIVSPHDKSQFENVLAWVKMNQDDKFFRV